MTINELRQKHSNEIKKQLSRRSIVLAQLATLDFSQTPMIENKLRDVVYKHYEPKIEESQCILDALMDVES